jgi:reactive intermediate/imine deaminase
MSIPQANKTIWRSAVAADKEATRRVERLGLFTMNDGDCDFQQRGKTEDIMSKNKLIRYDVADNQAGGQRRPFAKAVRAGDFVYVSGQVPTINGEIVTGNIVTQTEQVIANIKDVLALADCTLEHVVKVNVWLDDARDFSSFNAVFEKHFIDHPPARSTVQSPMMVDVKVEMDVIAYKPLD